MTASFRELNSFRLCRVTISVTVVAVAVFRPVRATTVHTAFVFITNKWDVTIPVSGDANGIRPQNFASIQYPCPILPVQRTI